MFHLFVLQVFNTTDKLIQIWKALSEKSIDKEKILELIKDLENFHLNILNEKFLHNKESIVKLIKNEFLGFENSINSYINSSDKTLIPNSWNDYSVSFWDDKILPIIWFWEILSCKIYSSVIDAVSENWMCSKGIDLSNLAKVYELKWKNEKEIFEILSSKISKIIEKNIKNWFIPILSWYVWIFEKWIESTIWRWYSDATAAIASVWLSKNNKVVLEIQKSVLGLLSGDPRILDNPKDAVLIEKLDYLTAREITWDNWAQAKLLHHQTFRSEIQEAWIKIHLYDPFSNLSDWSWIDDVQSTCELNSWVEFIWWRENMIFFTISSWKMFESWILTRIFSIVDDYFSVDIVSTSETEVTFTIDWKNIEDKIQDEQLKF